MILEKGINMRVKSQLNMQLDKDTFALAMAFVACFLSFAAKSFVSFYHSKDDLIRDDKVEGKSDPEFSRMRRLLQNSMDGARYLSAELEFVSNFIVPLSSHPRRILEIVSNATGSWK